MGRALARLAPCGACPGSASPTRENCTPSASFQRRGCRRGKNISSHAAEGAWGGRMAPPCRAARWGPAAPRAAVLALGAAVSSSRGPWHRARPPNMQPSGRHGPSSGFPARQIGARWIHGAVECCKTQHERGGGDGVGRAAGGGLPVARGPGSAAPQPQLSSTSRAHTGKPPDAHAAQPSKWCCCPLRRARQALGKRSPGMVTLAVLTHASLPLFLPFLP